MFSPFPKKVQYAAKFNRCFRQKFAEKASFDVFLKQSDVLLKALVLKLTLVHIFRATLLSAFSGLTLGSNYFRVQAGFGPILVGPFTTLG